VCVGVVISDAVVCVVSIDAPINLLVSLVIMMMLLTLSLMVGLWLLLLVVP